MKFLITNYSSESQTESSYFHTALNLINGCSSVLWDYKKHSAYDIFDYTKPDYYITHINSIHNDAISYMKENGKCKLIVNATGPSKEDILKIEKLLLDNNIDIAFFFTNDEVPCKLKQTNILSIPFGADVFIQSNKIKYNLQKAFLVVGKVNNIDFLGSYHTLSYNEKLSDFVDIALPEIQLAGLYKNYDNIVIKFGSRIIPQIFFDAVYHGNMVNYELEDSDELTYINDKLGKLLKIDFAKDSANNFQNIKEAVRSKHTCLNRVKSLLSQLPSNDIISNVDDLIKMYAGDIK